MLNIRLAPQPLDVGVPADHAGCRAGRIKQDAVEGLPVPPDIRGCSVGTEDLAIEITSLQVFPESLQPRLAAVNGEQQIKPWLTFQDVYGLPAGRCTGVQDSEGSL